MPGKQNYVPAQPNVYQGKQIVINSDRVLFNAKEDSSEAKIEDYRFKCRKRNPINETGSNNELYVKAVLKSSDTSVTPKIDQIQVRVI